MRSVAWLLLAACASQTAATRSGSGEASDDLYAVCWPDNAPSSASVTLETRPDGTLQYEASEGQESVGRCIREIGYALKPKKVVVTPPEQPATGWQVLAWNRLLAPSEEDPAARIRGCLAKGAGLRPGAVFSRDPSRYPSISIPDGAVTDTERCVEAVLSSVRWANSRKVQLRFKKADGPIEDMGIYFAPDASTPAPLSPARIKELVILAKPTISDCWEQHLTRFPEAEGARTLRIRVDDSGSVTHAYVAANLADNAGSLADFELDRCIVKAVKAQRSPGPAGEGAYTWVFAHRE